MPPIFYPITLVLGYSCLCTYLLHVGWSFIHTCRQGRLRDVVAEALSWLPCRKKNKDGLDVKVRRLIEQERTKNMRRYARPFLHVYGLGVAMLLCYHEWSSLGTDREYNRMQTCVSLLDIVFCFALCKFVLVFPTRVTSRMLDILYIVLSTWWVMRMLVVLQNQGITPIEPVHFLVRAILGVVVCNVRVTVSCNAALWVCHSLALWWCEAYQRNDWGHVLGAEAYGTVVIILALIFFEHAVQLLSRQVLEIKASSKTEVTVLRLLSALCDAVVTLDPDLQISTRAPKLANLLLQGNSARALQGSHFVDLLAETDQERFRQFLARAPEVVNDTCHEPEPAQSLNVALRDSIGTAVQAQLFHSHFHDDNGQVWHLIGVCEVGDTGGRQAQAATQRLVEPNTANAPCSDLSSRSITGSRTSWDTETFIGDSVSVAGGPTHANAQGSADMLAPLRGEVDARALWNQLQPCECGVAFDTLRFSIWQPQATAPVVDASLLELESLQQWVSEWVSCRAWMQDFINAALRPVNASSWPATAAPPSCVSFHIGFRGSCCLPPDVLTEGEAPHGGGGAGGDAADAGRAAAVKGATAPPLRVAVSRVKLVRNRAKTAVPSRGLRRSRHNLVQPTLVGATGEALPATANSSPPGRGSHGRSPTAERPAGPERALRAGHACL